VTQLTEVLQIIEGVRSTVLKGNNVVNVPTARTHTNAATTANIASIDNNSPLNVSGDCFVMVVITPLGGVLLSYAARHQRTPI
jgi:hypothetical protein